MNYNEDGVGKAFSLHLAGRVAVLPCLCVSVDVVVYGFPLSREWRCERDVFLCVHRIFMVNGFAFTTEPRRFNAEDAKKKIFSLITPLSGVALALVSSVMAGVALSATGYVTLRSGVTSVNPVSLWQIDFTAAIPEPAAAAGHRGPWRCAPGRA